MKKTKSILLAAMMAVIGVGLAGCAAPNEGETSDDWMLRNTINGPGWHVEHFKRSDGTWAPWYDYNLFYFWVKFSASKHNFQSEKFYYDDEHKADESTREKYDDSDNTGYTIRDASIVEATVNGEPYFRITLLKEVGSTMECTLYFYRERRSFDVRMMR